jgi:uncharacterized protein YcbK (DUF882 family)
MSYVTPHLSWAELGCHDGEPYPAEWRDTRAVTLGIEFEEVRRDCGDRPITVSSGYRTPRWNVLVGGARHSQHVQGRAIDMRTPGGMLLDDFAVIVLGVARNRGVIRGVGVYPWGVHMDIRESQRLVHWQGARVAPEVMRV